MAGLSLTEMGSGPDRYRGSIVSDGWPTELVQAGWDTKNALTLVRSAGAKRSQSRHQVHNLARRLAVQPGADGSPVPSSMASVRHRYAVADDIGAHLAQTCDELLEPAHFFTVIPTYGEVDEPGGLDPTWANERFRNDLNDCGARGSGGILFAVLEAEYQSRTGRWRFHWHGVACGGKLRAVDSLRRLKAYHSWRRKAGEPKAAVPYRVRVTRRPLYDLPKPLTYCIKPWNARWEDENGERSRRRRMPREVIPAALLWQDQWSISDIALLMGLRPGRNGFVVIGSTPMKKYER